MSKTWMEEALRCWREERQLEPLSELLKSQRDRAYAVALRLARSSSDAEDVVQEAFLKLLSRTTGFENVETFEATVYRAVVQCALDALRKRARRTTHEGSLRKEEPCMENAEEMTGGAIEADREKIRTLLRGAVEELPHDERIPVVLCFYQGLTVAQTARTLNLPRGTLRKRLARALDRLRRCLKQNDRHASSAIILALLWQDGTVSAPERLCVALDRAMPGRSCAEIPALPQPGPAAVPGITSAWAAWGPWNLGGLATASLLAAAVCVSMSFTTTFRPLEPSVSSGTIQKDPEPNAGDGTLFNENSGRAAVLGGSTGDAPSPRQGMVFAEKKEEESMKSKLGAFVLLGGMLLPYTVSAGDANPEAAKVIEQIEARRAEKAAAEAKAAAAYANAAREGKAPGNPAPGASSWGRQ